jgi:hypothetical protein
MIIGFWKLLYGYSIYFTEVNTWPKQKVFKEVYNVKENIMCNLRNKYFFMKTIHLLHKKHLLTYINPIKINYILIGSMVFIVFTIIVIKMELIT